MSNASGMVMITIHNAGLKVTVFLTIIPAIEKIDKKRISTIVPATICILPANTCNAIAIARRTVGLNLPPFQMVNTHNVMMGTHVADRSMGAFTIRQTGYPASAYTAPAYKDG